MHRAGNGLCDGGVRGLCNNEQQHRGYTEFLLLFRGFAPLSTGHVVDVVRLISRDGQIEASCNRGNGAIHRDIPVHPLVENIVRVVHVMFHERLQQRTVEQMVNTPVPQVVDVTSERVRKRTDEQIVHAPIPFTPPTKGNGAK